ncbi:MAG TPA: hypothetical protein VMR50_12095 [Myxococcota bacterium]|nr:hypothetical protein [Myxococcota bacterium]
MTRRTALLAWLGALLCAGNAYAASPAPEARASELSGATGSGRICEGGTNPGVSCPVANTCNGGGTCTGFVNVRIAARGLLTIIADTKTPGAGWTTTSLSGCTNATGSQVGSCELSNNALFTLLLEFTLNGKKYAWAETFARLPDGNNCTPVNPGDCLPQIPAWPEGSATPEAGWNEPAVESSIAEKSMSGQTLQLRWGGLPPAAEAAVGPVVGRTGNQHVVLSRVDEVPICTDATPCNLSATNLRFSDHSAGTDILATVRRFKVDIAVVGP